MRLHYLSTPKNHEPGFKIAVKQSANLGFADKCKFTLFFNCTNKCVWGWRRGRDGGGLRSSSTAFTKPSTVYEGPNPEGGGTFSNCSFFLVFYTNKSSCKECLTSTMGRSGPEIQAVNIRLCFENWRNIDQPGHLHFSSKKSSLSWTSWQKISQRVKRPLKGGEHKKA